MLDTLGVNAILKIMNKNLFAPIYLYIYIKCFFPQHHIFLLLFLEFAGPNEQKQEKKYPQTEVIQCLTHLW